VELSQENVNRRLPAVPLLAYPVWNNPHKRNNLRGAGRHSGDDREGRDADGAAKTAPE
jgi:hypothetical protein